MAARSSLAGPDPGWCVSLDQHPPVPCWGSAGMLSSTVHPTDPHHRDPLAARGGWSSKLAPPRSLPVPVPVCSSAQKCPRHRTSPKMSSSWKGGEGAATLATHHGLAQLGVPVSPPSRPSQGHYLGHSFTARRARAATQITAMSSPARTVKARRWVRAVGRGETGQIPAGIGAAGSARRGGLREPRRGGRGWWSPPALFPMAVAAVWPWCGVSVRGTPPQAVGCPVRGEGDPGDAAVTAGCRRGTLFSTSAMSPGLGTAGRWVEDTPRGGSQGGTAPGSTLRGLLLLLAAPAHVTLPCTKGSRRLARFCVSPHAGWCPVPCQRLGTGRELAGHRGVTRHRDKHHHPVLPFVEAKPVPPQFFDRSAASNSIFCVHGLF